MGDGDAGPGDTAGDSGGPGDGVGSGAGSDGGYGGGATGGWNAGSPGQWGDYIGSADDLYGFDDNMTAEQREAYFKKLGYGGQLGRTFSTGDSGNGFQFNGGTNLPGGVHDWFKNSGIGLKTMYDNERNDTFHMQAFGPNGSKLGQELTQKAPDDKEFGLALMAAAGGFAAPIALGAAGAGAGVAAATQGGLSAGATFGSGGSAGDILKAGASGAAGSYAGGLAKGADLASMTGVTDPVYARALNGAVGGAVGGGVNAAVSGQPIGSAILTSLAKSGLSTAGQVGMGALNTMGDDYNQNYGHEGGSDLATNGFAQPEAGGYSPAPMSNTNYTDMMTGNRTPQPNVDYSPAAGMNGSPLMDAIAPGATPSKQRASADNPIMTHALSLLQNVTGGGQPGRMDNMAGGLMDLWNRYKQNKQQSGLRDNLQSMFGPNSPYAQRLGETLARHDAASGRASQVGSRNVELQARLAEMNSRNAPLINQMSGQMTANRNMGINDILKMMSNGKNGGGGLDMLRGAGTSLSNYFNTPSPGQGVYMGQDPSYDADVGG